MAVESARVLVRAKRAPQHTGLGANSKTGADESDADALQKKNYCPSKKRTINPPRVVVIGKAFDT